MIIFRALLQVIVWTCFHTRCLLTVYEFDLMDQRERHLADPFRPSRRPLWLLLRSGSRKYSNPVFPPSSTATSCGSSRPHSCFCFRSCVFDDLCQAHFCAARITEIVHCPGVFFFFSLATRARFRPDGRMIAAKVSAAFSVA